MAASLAAFSVDLRANLAGFESDLGRAARMAEKESQAIQRTLQNAGQVIGAGLAVAATAITALVKSTIDMGDELNKMSQKVGVSVESLSVLRQQAQLSDVAMESLQGGLVKMAKAATAAAQGSKQQADAFKAIGVSAVDANGNLKGTQQLFTEIAGKFANYNDSAGKAALATQFFGKTGADLIPLLNSLGTQGFESARKQAEAFGLVMSEDAAKASEQFNDNLTMLQQSAAGFGVQLTNKVIGALSAYTDQMVKASMQGANFAEAADVAAGGLKAIVFGAVLVKNSVEAVINVFLGLYDTAKTVFSTLGQAASVWAEGVAKQFKAVFTFDFAGASAAAQEGREKLSAIFAETSAKINATWETTTTGLSDAVADVSSAYAMFGDEAKKAGDTAAATADQVKKTEAPLIDTGEAAKGAAKEATALAAAQQKLADIMSKLDGALSPVNAAWQDFANTAQDAVEAARKAIANHGDEAAILQTLALVMAKATAARERDLAAIKKQGDVLGNYLEKLNKDRALLGLTDRQKAVALAVQDATDKFNANTEAHIANAQTLEELTGAVAANEGAFYDQSKAISEAQASAEKYASIVRGAFDSMIDKVAEWAVNGFKNAKDFWKGMVSTLKQAVAQMLAEWAKTKIIGWFTGNSKGGGGGWTGLAAAGASYFGGGSSGGGDINPSTGQPMAQQTGGFTYGGTGNSFGNITNYGNLLTGAGNSFFAGAGGAYGPPTAGQAAFNTYTPWLAALGGAMYGATRGDGGVGTVAGIAAGAIAGYYAGTVAVGAVTGASAAAAAGGTAAAAGGAAAGASTAITAIPVIGWVAAIILAIDYVSGGKVLGTKYRPEKLRTDISFDDSGASADANLTEWKYRRNILQWNPGGSIQAMQRFGEKDRREKEIAIDPEMIAMINKMFDSFKKTYIKAAEALNVEVASIVAGTFETITKYTKKGKVKSEKTFSNVLGKTYEESFEDFQARMHAEGLIATLMKIADGASKLADTYRANAQELMDAAATMFQGQVDMNAGKGLLFVKQDLAEMMKRVEFMRSGDEKLIETYQRLAQATQQYRDIMTGTDEAIRLLTVGTGPVDQMKEALAKLQKQLDDNSAALQASALAAGAAGAAEADLAKLRALNAAQIAKISTDFYKAIDDQIASLTAVATPSNDFRAAMRAIQQQFNDNIGQANLLAKAMGQSGISAENLARIMQLTARQAAAAIAQLVNIGKAQAHSLGYSGPQNLTELDAAIADLQGRAGSASSSINDFGGAIGAAAEAADNAINLLLGSLSPLNDQQKLQTALGGLYAGTVSQEQVLEIGRRLFASTSQYTALFNQVMAVGPRAGKGNGDVQYGGAYASTTGLSNEDSRRLAELLAQRDDMVRAQRLAEARELANTVATAAAAEGATFAQIAAEMGFNLSQLATDLGLSADGKLSIEEYLARIDVTQDDIPDSITSNTDRMIARMDLYWGSGSESGAMNGVKGGIGNVVEVTDRMTAFVRTRGDASDAKTDVLIDKGDDMVMALRELVGLYREALGNPLRSVRTGETPLMPR